MVRPQKIYDHPAYPNTGIVSVEIKERPILFSGSMVQAIQEGRKTQTRRIVKEAFIDGSQPYPESPIMYYPGEEMESAFGKLIIESDKVEAFFCCPTVNVVAKCRYGKPFDLLWVRETYTIIGTDVIRGSQDEIIEESPIYCYKGEKQPHIERLYKWKPSIHMPKDAARIWLKVISIKVESLQDISPEDCVREGIVDDRDGSGYYFVHGTEIVTETAWEAYRQLWIRINGQESWDSNPWVWVIEFEKVTHG